MPDATRLGTDMSGWMPVTWHYEVPGGHLAVTRIDFYDASGTHVTYCDADGAALSTTALVKFPTGTTHDEALEALGYTVIDTIGGNPFAENAGGGSTVAPEPSVLTILPEDIYDAIIAYYGEEPEL